MTLTTDEKLDAILKAVGSLETRVSHLEEKKNNGQAELGGKRLSIKEFLLDAPPKTDIQRTLAIAYFLEKHAKMDLFSKADLEKGYSDAREPQPSNISVNIKHCIKAGHLMESSEKKDDKPAYVVTRSGEQFVIAGFPKANTKK